MSKIFNHRHVITVELVDGIKFRTTLPSVNIPALRSGFAGYPANPRWNAVKFAAWKTGRQLRQALDSGQTTVRASDRVLVDTNGEVVANSTEFQPPPPLPRRSDISFFSLSLFGWHPSWVSL
ncbi:hypothetical protein JJD41_19260 [Oxynema sp. CENA135]|uniref:hypothetical protein n=1 Tax=Oxynema sp. CENA135 TaxID=984206 RepID=UPI00190D0C37|nr:hypothetical protein [Oxynema sp. CENA135]MBK4731992.1 hypothetical protein [Oxynema sp. CENA135]